MAAKTTWFQTTAIDYPNSRPHIGTAFEKLGADVQARYRRMEIGEENVFFLMGNDENTVKVSKRAAELGLDTQAYCDDMARQFQEVWKALDISYDTFVQTSSERHKQCCRKFIQKVYDNGYIYKGEYGGWYCDGCEEFKSDKQHAENAGNCPTHRTPLVRRSEPCYFFKLSAFSERLLKHYEENPDFIQPEIRKNEIVSLIKTEGLRDINISRKGEDWGIQIPFDPEFTIYVWFDALLTYITGIGYGDDEATFRKYWPCDTHFIGKDITRFHTALWPAMLWAAGEEAPTKVFAHGFVYLKLPEKVGDKGAGELVKIGKTTLKELGLEYLAEPMEIIKKFSAEAFRYFFLRECPYPGDGDFSPERFVEVYNSELANNLGNLFSREMTITWKNFEGVFAGTAGKVPEAVVPGLDLKAFVETVRGHVEGCRYNQALQAIVQDFLTPTNQYLEANAPWKLVKTDKDAAKRVLFNAVQSLRVASILLKPFIPKSAEAIYTSFNFPKPWAEVKYADAAELLAQPDDLRVTAELFDGKPKPLFPRIG
ncbi:methionyl-trna synthetase : Methionine--tRNA ligase OS=Singulisphaera acidiphila (strain ATCC BAA-1392 / DSM 18658 / VKM B-2454 / MOB10) GN=metG PE=3 SV=1: tRNA-synt_1g: Anticodon_1 [Gemmataceae bacterium]|nr:methionyl-trna synthetase : Methionine--tRNA ligase OS=Singulisphaera acidiphila (strain ATCC BAA-1392 / DSM 18658 / VKM B-2454 / MOB10) GN=metG PE=3 SV=1: tRNA-synt_1g: Anticodon_1 [Gemmataceae bacterium]VTU02311.1 methionyl-trna synthetase : Methionine--tRNA ligase OS=Singulisphaera acidiphila (strain ATCC BAA-1392 / DSM 18658 / VKM B-2454 / MOB10) GN=metG PE=3 SV=1: tRNA-synt_1g: Anticodon_1 [Gemmataceae bacterium]